MTMELAFQIVLGLSMFLGGFWVNHLQQELKSLRTANEQIRENFQRRDDAQHSNRQIMEALQVMQRAIERIDHKLDNKADK